MIPQNDSPSFAIRSGRSTEVASLLTLWEASVRATHLFLEEKDIVAIRKDIPAAMRDVTLLVAAGKDDTPVGFLGLSGSHVEMLFVAPAFFRQGVGTALLNAAQSMAAERALTVDVNEQNHDAMAFYMRQGFRVAGRSPFDRQGRPFPLLHLAKTM